MVYMLWWPYSTDDSRIQFYPSHMLAIRDKWESLKAEYTGITLHSMPMWATIDIFRSFVPCSINRINQLNMCLYQTKTMYLPTYFRFISVCLFVRIRRNERKILHDRPVVSTAIRSAASTYTWSSVGTCVTTRWVHAPTHTYDL